MTTEQITHIMVDHTIKRPNASLWDNKFLV